MLAGLLMSGSAFGWGREGHETIAKIADNNLKPSARKVIEKYLGDHSIVYYAKWMDEYRHTPEYAFTTKWHVARVDEDLRYSPYPEAGDAVSAINDAVELLKDYKNLPDSTVAVNIKYLLHLVGDMHCPEHIQYNPEDMSIGKYKVRFDNRNVKYHTFWDEEVFTRRNPFSFSDTALLLDTWSDERIAATVAGGPYDWAEESARRSYPVHAYKEGAELKRVPYLNEFTPLAEDQIRRAGYRLAKLLNDIFGR